MEIATQLSVFIENRPGTLAAMCDELAKHNVNIFALTISDTVDHAVVRMVVSEPRKALTLFEERGVLTIENKVLLIENSNKPGSLSKIAAKLGEAKINIEYAYATVDHAGANTRLILKTQKAAKAQQILRQLEDR